LSPQINISYLVKKLNIRGGIGKSIRAADYTERYVSTNLSYLSPNRSLGNPNLEEEKSWNFEAGVDYFFSSSFKLSGTLFYRFGDRSIDYVATLGREINTKVKLDSNGTYFYAQNLPIVNTVGFEAEMYYQWNINDKSAFNVNLGFTYLSTQNPQGEVSKYVSSHANYLINGNLEYNFSIFNVGFSGLWKDRKTAFSDAIGMKLSPMYAVLNGVIGFSFLKNKLQVELEVMNIFNVDYQDILGAIMPGRWFIGSLAYTL
jgi:iron complex outermembrane receptor protein